MAETCHHCDYDLMGLPAKGNCPECGEFYDKHSSYRAIRTNEPVAAGQIKWIALAVFTLIVLFIGGLIAIQADRSIGAIVTTLIIASVSGFGSFAYWWSERQERRGAD